MRFRPDFKSILRLASLLLNSRSRYMPSFTFLARDAGTGREIRSSMDAPSEQQAIASLLGRNLLVVEIAEKAVRRGKAGGTGVPLADLVVFTRQLSTMIDAGL